jgi:L-malate glycosyltransferase
MGARTACHPSHGSCGNEGQGQSDFGCQSIFPGRSELDIYLFSLRRLGHGAAGSNCTPDMASERESEMRGGERKIRVLHLIDSLELGGAQTALFAWLREHDRSRFEVHLASMHGTSKSLFYSRAKALGISLILLSPSRWAPFYLWRLPFRMMLDHYDVVHCHLLASNWLGKPLARLFGVPVIVSEDQCNDAIRARSALVRWIDRVTNAFSDRVIAVSKSIRDFLVKYEGVPADRIRVIPNGLPEKSRPLPRKFSGKVVGGAGRLVAQKNFERFLRIANALQQIDPEYEFRIAGEGPLEHPLRRLALELGVRIEWLGAQPSLERFFSEIDLFLLTSDFEGLPMTVLEALQSGVPAAAMAVDGLEEEFTDEIALLDMASTDSEIARQIHALLLNGPARIAQIERGFELVSTRFSARAQIREIEEIYLELLAGRRSR